MSGAGGICAVSHLKPAVPDVDSHSSVQSHPFRQPPAIHERAVARARVPHTGAELVDVDARVVAGDAGVLEPQLAGGGPTDRQRTVDREVLAAGQNQVQVVGPIPRSPTRAAARVAASELATADRTEHRDR